MRMIRNPGIFLLFAFVFQSCMSPLTEKDNGRIIELADESSFTVNLLAEPGMIWKVVSYDKDLIEAPTIEISDITGDSGQLAKEYSFSFQTHGSGESVVSIDYLEENDTNEIPSKTFEVKIICGTMGRIESH